MKNCKNKARPYLNSTRYDSESRLIYKETVEDDEKYIHHMSYNYEGKRIYYSKIKASTNEIVKEEYTIYSNTQDTFSIIFNYDTNVMMVRTGYSKFSVSNENPNGFIHTKMYNSNTGDITTNTYNKSNGKYTSVTTHSPFKFILKNRR